MKVFCSLQLFNNHYAKTNNLRVALKIILNVNVAAFVRIATYIKTNCRDQFCATIANIRSILSSRQKKNFKLIYLPALLTKKLQYIRDKTVSSTLLSWHLTLASSIKSYKYI